MNIIYFNIILLAYFMYLGLICKRYLHMLQLNSYMNLRYTRWFKNSFRNEIGAKSLLPILPIAFFILGQNIAFVLTWVMAYVYVIYKRKVGKEKKKFVFTVRVKRLCITILVQWIVLYALALYIYLDYNRIQLLILFISIYVLGELKISYVILANTINYPVEKLINLYYYWDAKNILQKNKKLLVIGITGSYGKTSSKYILSRLLSAKYNVLMTPESYNTLMGVIRTIREHLKPIHEIFVVEMGAKKNGDIREICQLVNPKYALITSIGYQHLETFKNIENIIKTKYELVNEVKNGVAFLNFENEFIKEKKSDGKYFSYGINNNSLSYWAENIIYNERGLRFILCNYKGERIEIKTKLLGIHNVLNIISACAIAMELGVLADEICYTVKQIPPVPHRLELTGSASGITVIDDAFNSNPEGASEALNVLSKFDSPMRILITPGMVELGEKEYEANYKFGKKAAASCDYIILVGVKRSKPILEGIQSLDFSKEKVYIANNLNEALEKMKTVAVSGSVVLLENDLPDNYE